MDRNILVYRLGSIGDTILSLPAFHLARRSFPDAKFTLLTNMPVGQNAAPVEQVLENTGLVDEVLKYRLGLRRLRRLWSLRSEIAKQKFDAIVYITESRGLFKSVRDYLFFLLCGISRIIGVPFRKGDLHSLEVPGTGLYLWEAERMAGCLRELGVVDLSQDEWWDLKLTAPEENEAEQLLHDSGISLGFIGASVGAKSSAKDWTDANWLVFIKKLSALYPTHELVLVGSAYERERSEDLLTAWNGRKANLCGLSTPRVSAALLKRAKVFVGHDSGPMHLAGVVGTPCVAIFSARNLPGKWYPRGKNNTILYHQTFCYGCQLDVCNDYMKHCILSISVEDALNAIRTYL